MLNQKSTSSSNVLTVVSSDLVIMYNIISDFILAGTSPLHLLSLSNKGKKPKLI